VNLDRITYPVKSDNPNRKRANFWNEMGLGVGHLNNLNQVSDTLLRAPLARYRGNDYQVENEIGREARGKISLMAAQKIFGRNVSENDELIVRMLEENKDPERSEVFDVSLEVEEMPEEYREVLPRGSADPLMMQEMPDEMEIGQRYDFAVIHYGDDGYIIPDSGTGISPRDLR